MVTANTTGREAAGVRIELLRAYLEPLLMIVGQREQRISYVDCCSGSWQQGSEDPFETPVGVTLEIMEKCHNELTEKFRKNVHFRALFLEADKGAFGGLESFLKTETWGGIDTHCLNGGFHDLRNEILSWCGSRDFCFFLVNPVEWRDAAVSALRPVLMRPSSEFLINVAFDSVVRARAEADSGTQAPFLRDAPDVSGLSQEERERLVFDLYCQGLRDCATRKDEEIPRCPQMSVVYQAKTRSKYDLIYLTWSPVGVITFMEASEQFEISRRKSRAQVSQNRKVKRSGQLELFSVDMFAADEPTVDLAKIKEYWLSRLTNVPVRFGVAEFADMLEETGWFVNDFQKAFLELEREGKVRNLASTGMRTENAVHYWANGNRGEPLEKL